MDELPFDKKASTIEIADDMYADWYRDINENQDEYNNKTLILKGRVVKGGDMKHGGVRAWKASHDMLRRGYAVRSAHGYL